MSLLVNYYFIALAIWVLLTVLGAIRVAPGLYRDWRRNHLERQQGRSPNSLHSESQAIKNWKMGS